jgi:hypothetical protein
MRGRSSRFSKDALAFVLERAKVPLAVRVVVLGEAIEHLHLLLVFGVDPK